MHPSEEQQELVEWTSSQVRLLMPYLDPAALKDAVSYSLSLPQQDTERHWRSLLGSSPQVDSFLVLLREKRSPPKPIRVNAYPSPKVSSLPSSSPVPSRTQSPAAKVLRITKRGPGKWTSDLGKSKPPPSSQTIISRAAKENRPLSELEEIDSAMQSISQPSRRRFVCGCYATTHEIFPLAPNCISCGRIICVEEGLGPCPFCGVDLVSEDQRSEVLKELKLERGIAKTKLANEKVRKVKAGENRQQRVWATKAGGTEYSSQSDSETYIQAQRKRDELLEFDRTFAERTRIIGIIVSMQDIWLTIDQQAEFEPHVTLSESFATPQERAKALRKLQQLEAEKVAAERARHQRVLDIDFTSGKGKIRQAQTEDLLVHGDVDDSSDTANSFPRPIFVDR